MIGIVDYGMGNLASIRNALIQIGYETIVTDQPQELNESTHIILPGVGSFQAAVEEIDKRGLRNPLVMMAEKKPLLGICLGMQLLFTTGFEGGKSQGLGIIPGTVEKLETKLILPHIGWNTLNVINERKPFERFQNQSVYFVHSYGIKTTSEFIVGTTDYGTQVPAIVKKGNIYGMQFHPEKSGKVGFLLLQTFLEGAEV